MSDSAFDRFSVEIEKLTRENTVVMTQAGAVVQRGLVVHGCKPPIMTGDVILEVNDQKFTTFDDLAQLLSSAANFKVLIKRPKTDKVDKLEKSEEAEKAVASAGALHIERFIFEIKRESPSKPFGLYPVVKDESVYVEKVEGLAKEAGLLAGDRLVAVNGKKVLTVADIDTAVQGLTKVVVHVTRGAKPPRKLEFEKKLMTLNIPFEAGDMLGVKVDKNLVVTEIQPGCIGEGRFELNDCIRKINGVELGDDKEFYNVLMHLDSDLTVDIMRNMVKDDSSAKTAEKQTSANNLVMISLAMSVCEPLGVRADEKMLITAIQSSSHAEGKFELGDVIKLVNGVPVKDQNQFFKLFDESTARGRANIVVERSATRELELEMRQLPPNVEKMIKRRAGFEYIMVNVRFNPKCGRPFGLNMANVTSHKIMVPEMIENTVAGDYFKAYDHIVAINGTPVSDTTVAKKIIRECCACFQVVIERPISVETTAAIKKEVDEWKAKMLRPPTPRNVEEMPVDVQEIVRAHLKRREGKPPKVLSSAFRKADGPRRCIKFAEKHTETPIQSDVPPTKRLRSCR